MTHMPDANETITFTPETIAEVFGPAAPDAEVAETPAPETPAPVESKPAEAKVAERIAAAKRAEIKAARERQEVDAKRRELTEKESSHAIKEADIKLFEDDPAAFIASKGWNQQQVGAFLEKLAGQVKPEAVAEKKLSAQEQRIKDLEDKLAAKDAAETTTKQATAIAEAEKSAGEAFLADVSANADKFPNLTQEFNETEAVQEAFARLRAVVGQTRDGKPITRVQAFIAQHGRGPTHEEIAEFLDGIAQKRIEARASASWGKKEKPTLGSQPLSGDQVSTPPVKGSSPRTLSRADTSQRAAAPKSTAWSQERADEESLAIFERAMKKS